MKTFIYKGKERSAAGGILLHPETNVELPENDAHVKSLLAQNLLSPVVEKKQKDNPAIEKSRNENNSKKSNSEK